ncbi:hypothetical protein H0H81_011230 [Sphagnurus paluster]|uniref:cutinase n=1 Tax=Sphagnurus paluster TaxID=117069 RepID=A0A9P7KJH1_9AGAR|nr:hypothetical protein H0H81_011230 [Sphagnurus paluster]
MRSSLAVLLALALSAFAAPVADVDVEARQTPCADVSVYFARGTSESGTIGTSVGPQFKAALEATLTGKSVDFVGVPYPATVGGFLAGGDSGGATTMANLVTTKANSCASTKIVISGFSQGAQVVHLAAAKMTTAIQNRVDAAVVFGDPKKGQPFAGVINSRAITFCNAADNICAGGIIISPAHNYAAVSIPSSTHLFAAKA